MQFSYEVSYEVSYEISQFHRQSFYPSSDIINHVSRKILGAAKSFNIGSDFQVLVQIQIQLFHNTELDSNLKISQKSYSEVFLIKCIGMNWA